MNQHAQSHQWIPSRIDFSKPVNGEADDDGEGTDQPQPSYAKSLARSNAEQAEARRRAAIRREAIRIYTEDSPVAGNARDELSL